MTSSSTNFVPLPAGANTVPVTPVVVSSGGPTTPTTTSTVTPSVAVLVPSKIDPLHHHQPTTPTNKTKSSKSQKKKQLLVGSSGVGQHATAGPRSSVPEWRSSWSRRSQRSERSHHPEQQQPLTNNNSVMTAVSTPNMSSAIRRTGRAASTGAASRGAPPHPPQRPTPTPASAALSPTVRLGTTPGRTPRVSPLRPSSSGVVGPPGCRWSISPFPGSMAFSLVRLIRCGDTFLAYFRKTSLFSQVKY